MNPEPCTSYLSAGPLSYIFRHKTRPENKENGKGRKEEISEGKEKEEDEEKWWKGTKKQRQIGTKGEPKPQKYL